MLNCPNSIIKRKRAGVVPFCPKEEKILLMYRQRQGIAYYVICGGGVEKGESYLQAAKRELFEETELRVKKLYPLCFLKNGDKQSPEAGLKGKTEQTPLCSLKSNDKQSPYKEVKYFYTLCNDTPQLTIKGEELLRSSPQNVYIPSWIPVKDLNSLNISPLEVKEKLIAFFRNIKENS